MNPTVTVTIEVQTEMEMEIVGEGQTQMEMEIVSEDRKEMNMEMIPDRYINIFSGEFAYDPVRLPLDQDHYYIIFQVFILYPLRHLLKKNNFNIKKIKLK
jgi:hypothetical protein